MNTDIQLSQLLEQYLQHQRVRNYSPLTVRIVGHNVRAFLRWLLEAHGVTEPRQLRIKHLEEWLFRLSRHKTSRGRPLQARSVNKKIETARGYLKYLAKRGHIQPNLADLD